MRTALGLGMFMFFCTSLLWVQKSRTQDVELSHLKSDKQIMNTKYRHSLKYVKIAYRMDSTLKANNIKDTFILTD